MGKKKSIIFFEFFKFENPDDDVIMTSSHKLQLDLYINILNEFDEDQIEID